MAVVSRREGNNYQWWQEHGESWPEEIKRRKGFAPIYHIQEIFLAEYLSRNAPAKVLEFGCGFGRHLKYLSRIEGLELYGYDQSSTMIAGMHEWAPTDWITRRIALGGALQSLPYPDKFFDIVFTVSVLIHIRPEHVQAILKELVRVCRWQIIHIENNHIPDTKLSSKAHDGSWMHPIEQHYGALGNDCELMGKCFAIEDIYRVVFDPSRKIYDLNRVTLGNLFVMDQSISTFVNDANQSNADLSAQLASEQEVNRNLSAQLASEQEVNRNLSAQLASEQEVNRNLSAQLASEQEVNRNLSAQLASEQEVNRKLSAQLDAFEKQLAGLLQTDRAEISPGSTQQPCAGEEDGAGGMQTDQADHKRKLDITEQHKSKFRKILLETYFANRDPVHLNSETGRRDIEDHVCGRMLDVENRMLPWVGEVYDITGKSVLEIGCGTGSATVPFALRAHTVYSYDIDEQSLKAANQRATLLGVDNINFYLLDAGWARSEEGVKSFSDMPQVDVVLLIALLEHLTIEERINALRILWRILRPGGILAVYETPNRIGYFDWHSFLLPFFHYLPDQLALLYSVKTPRPYFKVDPRGDLNENLYRLGRGVSYHEFELALNFEDLTVINDGYSKHLRHRQTLSHNSFDKAVLEIFEKHLPHIPRGFTKPSLDLIIRKERDRDPAHCSVVG